MVKWTRLKITFILTLPLFVIQLTASRTHFLYDMLSAQLLKNFLAFSRTRRFNSVCTKVRVWSLSLLHHMKLVWNITPYLFEGQCYITVPSWSGLLLSDRCLAYKYLFFLIDSLYLFCQFTYRYLDVTIKLNVHLFHKRRYVYFEFWTFLFLVK